MYINALHDILRGQGRPFESNDGQATARRTWDAANHYLPRVINGSPLLVHTNTRRNDARKRGRIWTASWASLREMFNGGSREPIRAEHVNVNTTSLLSGRDPCEDLYIMDNSRDRLDACDPPQCPNDRKIEDVVRQALAPE